MIAITNQKLTFAEYLAYDNGTTTHYELEDGVLIPMPPASPTHVKVTRYLFRLLDREIQRLNIDWEIFYGDVGIRTKLTYARIPDISIVEGEVWRSLAERSSAVLETPMLLVVEVVSPGEESRERDYFKKKIEYLDMQIPEYWIVDPQLAQISILTLIRATSAQDNYYYDEKIYRGDDLIASQLFPQLKLSTVQIVQAGSV
jgi:Uma2 family endonuclease